jgi:tRNA-binding protein
MNQKPVISYEAFQHIDMRVGAVVAAEAFPEARRPALKLWIDFGLDIGVKQSSAQITDRYSPEQLPGRQVIAVVNFSPKQIGSFMSEVLVLGLAGEAGDVVLVGPDNPVSNGAQLL